MGLMTAWEIRKGERDGNNYGRLVYTDLGHESREKKTYG